MRVCVCVCVFACTCVCVCIYAHNALFHNNLVLLMLQCCRCERSAKPNRNYRKDLCVLLFPIMLIFKEAGEGFLFKALYFTGVQKAR